MTAIETTFKPQMRKRDINRCREQWDALQGREYGIDYERAELLHKVFVRHDRNEDHLYDFIVSILGEYPGKRSKSFVRMAVAFDTLTDPEEWGTLGGVGMVKLARVTRAAKRRKVMTRVRACCHRTGRTTISTGHLRNILAQLLTADEYQQTLCEWRENNGRRSLRADMDALKAFLFTVLKNNPTLRKGLPKEVKNILGVDLLEELS